MMPLIALADVFREALMFAGQRAAACRHSVSRFADATLRWLDISIIVDAAISGFLRCHYAELAAAAPAPCLPLARC